MTDGHEKNGNGLLKEIFETRERAAAWFARTLLLAISGLATVVLWLASQQLTDLKMAINSNDTTVWAAIGNITKNQDQNTNSITSLADTVRDHDAKEDRDVSDIRQEQQDHETRIRALESRREP